MLIPIARPKPGLTRKGTMRVPPMSALRRISVSGWSAASSCVDSARRPYRAWRWTKI